MKPKAFRQNQTGFAPPLKNLSPAAGTGGHKYELYHVNQLHIISSFARWVCDLPGEFCCFLRSFDAGRSCRSNKDTGGDATDPGEYFTL